MPQKRVVFLDLDGRQHDLGGPKVDSEKKECGDEQAQEGRLSAVHREQGVAVEFLANAMPWVFTDGSGMDTSCWQNQPRDLDCYV